MNTILELAKRLEEEHGTMIHTLSIDKKEKGVFLKRECEEFLGQEFYFEGNTVKAFITTENLKNFEWIATNLLGDPTTTKRGNYGITYTRTI